MKALSLISILLLTLNGCQLTRVEGKVNDVDVKVSTNEADSKGKFCPPGQAKKGNC
ncbi:hypothetical protein [Vibrio marisflavi]|uniref:Lipoprotein n=1 Tax=Vibrio marisflavi CECT 7928 TaxID=634439 RepID=A0ABM9A4K4_9VIBR|nr:hypothetical protein [Vibrio marisflavi]CAH0539823.1 hypothetical protein VMF7928_02476 [Vibrio marisflavi CECT 7928]